MHDSRAETIAAIERYFDRGKFLAELRRRIAVPTQSQEPDGAAACQLYLDREIAPVLLAMGFDVAIESNPDGQHGPFLLATRQESEELPTLLTYGHGDVVRGLPEQWRQGLDPWTLRVEGDHWYGRGTADNKGQHAVVIAALRQLLENRGRLGFNAKILIETGEEVGSPGLDAFCREHAARLAADVFIASDGPRLQPARADVALGNRGGMAFDLVVALREGSQHSGHWGGVLEDPGIILAQAIASITDRHGRILIPEWLPTAIPPKVRDAIAALPFDPSAASFDIPESWGEPGLSVPEKIYAWTGFIVLACLCGRPENPINGVQPWARATCQLRYTSDVDSDGFMPALRRHLDKQGFTQVEIVPADRNLFPAWRTDPDDPWVDWTLDSLARTTGERPNLVPNSSGGLPSEIFARHLDLPVLWIPHSYTGCKQHGPDEHLLAPMAREALAIMAGLFWDLGDSPPAMRRRTGGTS